VLVGVKARGAIASEPEVIMVVDSAAAIQFLRIASEPDDWLAVFLKRTKQVEAYNGRARLNLP
jgi:hypothetical protein